MSAVTTFINARHWRLLEHIDLGTTSDIFVVAHGDNQFVIKTGRDHHSVRLEYEILHYLNSTSMSPFVPTVGDWLHPINGFSMERLRYPTPAEKFSPHFVRSLAVALRTLHQLDLPPNQGIADDRPAPSTAVCRKFQEALLRVEETESWPNLDRQDQGHLACLRIHHDTYKKLLPTLKTVLEQSPCALIHGDLADDNLMVHFDNSLGLVDWGEARISIPLLDIAHLWVYSEWNVSNTSAFLHAYLTANHPKYNELFSVIETLARMLRYQSCVKSLEYLNTPQSDGLDAVGYAFFERQIHAL